MLAYCHVNWVTSIEHNHLIVTNNQVPNQNICENRSDVFYPNNFEQNRLFVTAFKMTYIAVIKVIHLNIYNLIPQTWLNLQ